LIQSIVNLDFFFDFTLPICDYPAVPATLFTIAPSAQAAGSVIGSTAPSDLMTDAGDISNITNQSGLSNAYTSGVTDFSSYVSTTTHNNSSLDNIWAFIGKSGVITLNLGASYTLDALALWPDSAGGGISAIRGFTLYADTDADTSNLGTSLGSFNAVNASSNPTSAQVFNFSATPTQYIQLQITSNAGDNSTALGEVAFSGSATAVPWETDALSVIGTTLLFAGGVWAKRKSAKSLDKE
jgi:hypothetical protein